MWFILFNSLISMTQSVFVLQSKIKLKRKKMMSQYKRCGSVMYQSICTDVNSYLVSSIQDSNVSVSVLYNLLSLIVEVLN